MHNSFRRLTYRFRHLGMAGDAAGMKAVISSRGPRTWGPVVMKATMNPQPGAVPRGGDQ